MRLWHWLFQRRGDVLTQDEKEADLVDAQSRLKRLERAARDRDRRLKRLSLEAEVKRRPR